MCEFEESLKAVRDVFVNYPKQYQVNLEYIKQIEKEENDIKHIAELTKYNASEAYHYLDRLGEILRERRRVKDENEKLEVILELINQQNGLHKNKLNQAIGKIRQVSHRQGNRRYHMRVRHDLQEVIDNRRRETKS